MAPFASTNAATALSLLADAAVERENELEAQLSQPLQEDTDEDNGSECPIRDTFYDQGGAEGIREMTNFSPMEFEGVWEAFKGHIMSEYNVGRGRKCDKTAKDVLFMTLAVLKHGSQWDFMGKMFDMKAATFERIILKFVAIISGPIYENYVSHQARRWSMKKMVHTNALFRNYPMARYATDVTFQPSNRPSGNLSESKLYFSKKHGLYGYKIEASVLPNGMAIGCSAHEPGYVSDFRMFQDMRHFHKEQLKKCTDELELEDDGPMEGEFPDTWWILLDKGYQGSKEFCRAIHPTKKPRNGVLSPAQVAENRHISSDRVLVENYFGRMSGIWNVVGSKWKWSEKIYDSIFMLCMGLTNWHIRWNPLRADDGRLYHKITNRWYKIGATPIEKRRRVQANYREKRRRRVDMRFRANQTTESPE